MKHVMEVVWGVTKDPGVSLFRMLKNVYHELDIDTTQLVVLNKINLPLWMQEESNDILRWAQTEYQKNTWPRYDYKELIELTIVMLGGTVDSFSIKFPGPDHHTRWMSKAIYILKIHLLLNVFIITDEERRKVIWLSEFILIF